MNSKETAAVIMAGGRGERLRPITDTTPKPLVEVGGRPAMESALSMLSETGINEATVTVRYMYEDIVERFGSSACGVGLDYYIETEPLGTAGGVAAAIRGVDFDELIVLSGDAVCDFHLREAISRHRQLDADATLLLTPSDEPWKYGCVRIADEESGRIGEFIEKPAGATGTALVNTGIYILSKRATDMIPYGQYDFGRELFPSMLERGAAVHGFIADGYWCDIGSAEALRRACFDAAKNRIRGYTAVIDGTGAVIDRDSRTGEGTRLDGCVLARGVTVGSDVHAENTIFCRGVTVGSRVSIGGGSVIGEGAFIGDGVRLPPETKLAPGAVVGSGAEIFAENL